MHRLFFFVGCSTSLVISACQLPVKAPPADAGDTRPLVGCDGCTVFTNGALFDGTQLLQNGTVVIENDRIRQVELGEVRIASGQVVDLDGGTLLPGLIDAHAHVHANWWPVFRAPPPDRWSDAFKALLRHGVTTVVDLQVPRDVGVELRSRVSSGRLLGPRYFTSGPKLAATDEATCPRGFAPTDWCVQVDTIDQAHRTLAGLLPLRPDFVKIALAPTGRMTSPVISALVAEAGDAGIDVIAHVGDSRDVETALDAGVVHFAHVPMLDLVSDALARRAGDAQVAFVTTIGVHDTLYRRSLGPLPELDDPAAPLDVPQDLIDALKTADAAPLSEGIQAGRRATVDRLLTNVGKLHRAGARLVAGTDSGVYGALFGRALHRELELLVQAGLTPEEALAAATSVPAEMLKRPDLGRIAVGATADLLVLRGNLVFGLQGLQGVEAVWLAGKRVDLEQLELPRHASLVRDPLTALEAGAVCLAASECGSGLSCSTRNACRSVCANPLQCSGSTSCIPDTTTSGVCQPSDGCNLLTQNCPNFSPCIFGAHAATYCWFAGPGGHGASCAQTGLCAVGMQCDPAVGRCRRLCDPGAPTTSCPAGSSCQDYAAFAGQPIGLCTG